MDACSLIGQGGWTLFIILPSFPQTLPTTHAQHQRSSGLTWETVRSLWSLPSSLGLSSGPRWTDTPGRPESHGVTLCRSNNTVILDVYKFILKKTYILSAKGEDWITGILLNFVITQITNSSLEHDEEVGSTRILPV